MIRRRARRRNPAEAQPARPRLGQLFNPYAPIAALDSDALDRIHEASMQILEDIGLEILSEQGLALYEQDGARVDWDLQRVYLDREQVMRRIETVPSEFTMHAPDPGRNRLIGRNAINFTTVASAPNCSDLDHGRRTGNFADYCNFMRLTQSFDVIDFFADVGNVLFETIERRFAQVLFRCPIFLFRQIGPIAIVRVCR